MRRPLNLMLQLAATAGLIAIATGSALADPSSDLVNASIATTKAPSYHVSVTTSGTTIESDVVNPNKAHTIAKDMEMIVIGSAMYVKMDGKWKKMNVPGLWSDPTDVAKKMQLHRTDFTATDLGMRTVGGVPYHAYALTDTKKHSKQTVYVDAAGRFGRVEASGIVMIFSKYGENVSIVAPM